MEAKGAASSSPLTLWLTSAAESLFATLFPADCRLCGTALIKISRLPVCDECLTAIRPISGGTCAICGERIFSPHAVSPDGHEPRCGLCRRIEPPFVRATAYGSYEGGLRELIHLLKYERIRPTANVLGQMLAEAIGDLEPSFGNGPVFVVPVPLHSEKLRQREFNQSELIVGAALKLKSTRNRFLLDSDVLTRQRATQSQIGLTRHQRRENIRGAFVVAKPEAIAGREVLLVDDVLTTGTTVSECARILRRARASKVWVATVARTLKEEAKSAQVSGRSEIHIPAAVSA